MKNILSILAVIILLSSCSLKPITVGDVKDVSLKKLTKESVTLVVKIPIKNENKFKFKITDVNIDMSVEGKKIGKIKRLDNITIPANSNNVYDFEIEAEFSKLMKGSMALMASFMKRSINVKLDGHIKAKAFGMPKKVEIHESERVNLNKYKLF